MIPERVFIIFSSVTVFGELCNWTAITVSHLKFRKHRMVLGNVDDIHFKSPFYPYADYFVLFFMALVVACIAISPEVRISLLISAIWVCVVFVFYKFYTRKDKMAAGESDSSTVNER
jgi:AAT family amino acid transporter